MFLGAYCFSTTAQITDQPENLEICEGSTATFAIEVSGSDSAFQWQTFSDSNWTDLTDGEKYSGCTTTEMHIEHVNAELNHALFRCLVDLDGDSVWDEISQEIELTVISIPVIYGPISGNQSVCYGSKDISYGVVPADGASEYEWTIPEGARITSGHNSSQITIDFQTAASGTISVIPTNLCHSGIPVSLPINIIPLITSQPQITGETEVCKDEENLQYSVSEIEEASGYQWEVPAGVSIAKGDSTQSITVDWNDAADGIITVTPFNSCFNGLSDSLQVIVGKEVSDPGPIAGPDSVCHRSSGSVYQISEVANASDYIWKVPMGAEIVSDQNSEIITIDWNSASSGNISVRASNRCFPGNSSTKLVTILSPIIPAVIEGAD